MAHEPPSGQPPAEGEPGPGQPAQPPVEPPYPQQSTPQPGYPQPGYPQPGYPQPGYPQPQQQYPGQPPWPPPRPRERAGWPGTLGLTAVLLFVTLGGFVFGGGAGAADLGETVPVGGGVGVQVAEGWEVIQQVEDPMPGIILAGPGGNALVGVPGSGSPQDLLEYYVNQILAPEAHQLSVGQAEAIELQSGDAGAVSYVGVFPDVATPLEGEVIGITTPNGTGVVVDGWAPEGTYASIRDHVVAMAGSVTTG